MLPDPSQIRDEGALLEGENGSRGLEDAEHWLSVYQELSDFARRLAMLGDAGDRQRQLARRFAARRRFWEERVRHLRRR